MSTHHSTQIIDKLKGIVFLIIPIILFLIFMLLSNNLYNISKHFSACIFYVKYGILCPGCGNTRCVLNLSKGHFLTALRDNITIPLILVISLYYYIKWDLHFFGIVYRDLIGREYVLIAAVVILLIYYVVRNFVPLLAPVVLPVGF